eukprot:UN03523
MSLKNLIKRQKPRIGNRYRFLANIACCYSFLHAKHVTIRHISTDHVLIDPKTLEIKIEHCKNYFYDPTNERVLAPESIVNT